MSSREHAQVHQVQAAGFVVCRLDLDKKVRELVGCWAFESVSISWAFEPVT